MVSSIENDQPQKCGFVLTHSSHKRRAPSSSSSSTSNTTSSKSRSIVSKFTIRTAIYALLYCTSHQDVVVAYSETKVIIMESHNYHSLEQEQINQPVQSSSLEDDRGTEVLLLGDHPYSSDEYKTTTTRRRMQRRGPDTTTAAASASTTESYSNMGYDAYGVQPSSNVASETNNNNVEGNEDSSGTSGWFNFGKKDPNNEPGSAKDDTINESSGNSAYGSYYGSSNGNGNSASSQVSTAGSAYGSSYGLAAAGSGGSTTGYGSYGSSPSNSAYGASSTSAYGGSSPRSSSSYYGGGSSYSSTWGAESASSTSSHQWGSSSSSLRGGGRKRLHSVKIDLLKAIFFLLLICTTGMLLTAHSMEHHPEGTFANCCRVSLHTVNCVYSIFFNLYHCRLGELPGIICGGSELEEGEYTEEELEQMTLRPGIERALDTEHRKALRKVGVEMNMIKPKNGNGGGRKSNGVRNGASISR